MAARKDTKAAVKLNFSSQKVKGKFNCTIIMGWKNKNNKLDLIDRYYEVHILNSI